MPGRIVRCAVLFPAQANVTTSESSIVIATLNNFYHHQPVEMVQT